MWANGKNQSNGHISQTGSSLPILAWLIIGLKDLRVIKPTIPPPDSLELVLYRWMRVDSVPLRRDGFLAAIATAPNITALGEFVRSKSCKKVAVEFISPSSVETTLVIGSKDGHTEIMLLWHSTESHLVASIQRVVRIRQSTGLFVPPIPEKNLQSLHQTFTALPGETATERLLTLATVGHAFRQELAAQFQPLIRESLQTNPPADRAGKIVAAKLVNDVLRENGLALLCHIPVNVVEENHLYCVELEPASVVVIRNEFRLQTKRAVIGGRKAYQSSEIRPQDDLLVVESPRKEPLARMAATHPNLDAKSM